MKKQTKPHNGAGKKPVWKGYNWRFPKQGNDGIKVELFDEDIGKDDFIGGGMIDINFITTEDQILNVPLKTKKGKDAGTCKIKISK